MARSRNIKPGFFTNDVLGELPPLARLLFAGIWTICDRAGRCEDRPKKIKAEVLPYDDCDADALLSLLQRAGFIDRYESGGQRVIQVLTWDKHQNPHVREAASTLPERCETGADTVLAPDKEQPKPERAGLIPDSGFLIPDSSTPSELSPAAPAPSPKPSRRASKVSMPPDFAVSDRVAAWASENCFDRLPEHLASFRLKAVAADYRYADWDAAFMAAVRDDWAKLRQSPRGRSPPAESFRQRDLREATEKVAFLTGKSPRPTQGDFIDVEATDVTPRRLG